MGEPSRCLRFTVTDNPPIPSALSSAAVRTEMTPGMVAAAVVSMPLIRAAAWGDRSTAIWAAPGTLRSSV